MPEVDERIAQLQEVLSAPDADDDTAVLRRNLRQLRQLRAEIADATTSH